MTDIYGKFTSGYTLRTAVEDTIKLWIRDYLGEAAVDSGFTREQVPVFKSYVGMTGLDHFVEEEIPGCLVLTPGTDKVVRRGRGHDITWSIAIVSVVSSTSRENTLRLSETYALALRLLMLQKPSMGGVATSTEFVGERYDELASDASRTIAAAYSQFSITVEDAVQPGGPTHPSSVDDPLAEPGEWPEVVSVDITKRRSA